MLLKELAKSVCPPFLFQALKKIKSSYDYSFSSGINYKRLCSLVRSNKEIQELFPMEEIMGHCVYEPMRKTIQYPQHLITQVRYYRLYEFFRQNYPELSNKEVSVVDIGDTSGVLFRAMKRKGLSLNINREVVSYIRSKGIEAQIGDAEALPLADKSFDYAFCFQCLEHLINPTLAIKELSRITKKKIFLSIPYVERTVIYGADYWKEIKSKGLEKGGWGTSSVKDVDCHKFEFSANDFKNLLSYLKLRCCDNFPINYFKPLGSTHKNEGSYFNFFILEPV